MGKLQRLEQGYFESWGDKQSQKRMKREQRKMQRDKKSMSVTSWLHSALSLTQPWWNNKLLLGLLIAVALADTSVSFSLIHFLITEQKENAELFLPEILPNEPARFLSAASCLFHFSPCLPFLARTCVCLPGVVSCECQAKSKQTLGTLRSGNAN